MTKLAAKFVLTNFGAVQRIAWLGLWIDEKG